MISAYEAKIDALEKERLVMKEKLTAACKPQRPLEEMFKLARNFFLIHCKLMILRYSMARRVVLKLAFEERVSYR